MLLSLLSRRAAWKAKTGHGSNPRAHSLFYFQPQDPFPPTTPPVYINVKPEPLNSWGDVSFDKWQWRPDFLLSCRHIVNSSVWSQDMCCDLSRDLWRQPASQVLASLKQPPQNKLPYTNQLHLHSYFGSLYYNNALHEIFKAIHLQPWFIVPLSSLKTEIL